MFYWVYAPDHCTHILQDYTIGHICLRASETTIIYSNNDHVNPLRNYTVMRNKQTRVVWPLRDILYTCAVGWYQSILLYIAYDISMTLPHRGRDKMAPFRRRHFQVFFHEWKLLNFKYNFLQCHSTNDSINTQGCRLSPIIFFAKDTSVSWVANAQSRHVLLVKITERSIRVTTDLCVFRRAMTIYGTVKPVYNDHL